MVSKGKEALNKVRDSWRENLREKYLLAWRDLIGCYHHKPIKTISVVSRQLFWGSKERVKTDEAFFFNIKRAGHN